MTDPRAFASKLEKLNLHPGDHFILEVDKHITESTRNRIQRAWRSFAGPNIKLFVIDKSMSLRAEHG